MKTLGGTVVIRDGILNDFCFVECVESILPVCDQVVISYAKSEDDTLGVLQRNFSKNTKVKIVFDDQPEKPSHDGFYVMNWTDRARKHLTTEYHIQMDADEVLHEDSYPLIQPLLERHHPCSLRVQRWNFWQDAQHMIPFSEVCGHEVIRIGPANLFMPADVPVPEGQDMMNIEKIALQIQIHHMGFIRKPEAFFRKEKFLQTAFTGGYDPKLDALEQKRDWMEKLEADWKKRPLEQFHGTHPKIAHEWLRERGYEP